MINQIEPQKEVPFEWGEELPGATLERKKNAVVYRVSDKEKWNTEAVSALTRVFGGMLFKEYEPTDEDFDPTKPDHLRKASLQAQTSFKDVDRVYVVGEGRTPAGFRCIELDKEVPQTWYGREFLVDEEQRGKRK